MQKSFDDKSWSFLIAAPSHSGEPFEESVVLILDDNEDGSFGVIVNKPIEKTLGELSVEFANTQLGDTELFDGGPLSKDKLSLAICSNAGNSDDGAFSFGVPPDKAIEILSKDPEAKSLAYLGYSAWAPNQLNQEISEGTWIVANVDIDMLFDCEPEILWRELLLKMFPKYSALERPKAEALFN